MKFYSRRVEHRVATPRDIPAAIGLLGVYHDVDIYVPRCVEADRYLLNQVTLALNQHGFPPAAIYGEGDRWRLHALAAVPRSMSIYLPAVPTGRDPPAAA